MNKVTSTIAVLIVGLVALVAYVLVTNQTVIEEDVQIQVTEIDTEQVAGENLESQAEIESESLTTSEELTIN